MNRKDTNKTEMRTAEDTRLANGKPTSKAILVAFSLLALSIVALGWGYYTYERHRIRHDAETNLGAIADLKVAQIAEWRRERVADGNVIMADRAALQKLAGLIDGSEEAGGDVGAWLEILRAQYGYHAAIVLDLEGRVRLAVGNHDEHMGEHMSDLMAACLKQGKPLFTKTHRADPSDHLHIGLLVPLITPHTAAPEPFGLLVLRIDPADFLFPFVQKWPTPSPTAETLLVRRDGDDVLFLNELRHRPGSAMGLRIPVSRSELPAARAVQGFSGSVRGMDYRGEPVLAAVRAISNSDWYMVSKVDVAEVDMPLHRVWPPVLASVLALIVACGAGVRLSWRKQDGRWLQQQVETERRRADAESDLRRAQERFRTYFEESLVGMAITSPERGWLQANRRLCDMLGYTLEELKQTTWPELTHPEDLPADAAQFERLLAGDLDGYSLDKRFLRRDGGVVPTILSVRAVRRADGTVDYLLAQLQDVTAHKLAMANLAASEARFRSILTLAPLPLAQVNNQGELVFINQRFKNLFGYDLSDVPDLDAWWPRAYPDPAYRQWVQETWEADVARAAREGVDIASREYKLTCKDGTVRNVQIGGVVIGDEFLATFIDRTEARTAEQRLSEFLAVTDSVVTTVDADGTLTYVNEAAARLFGLPADECVGRQAFDFIHPEDRETTHKAFTGWIEAGLDSARIENRQRSCNGECHDLLWTVNLRYAPGGALATAWSIGHDITQMKQTELALAENERRYRGIFDTAPVSIWEEDWTDVITMVREIVETGVPDMASYLGEHPDVVYAALAKVKIVDVNAATMSMFGARDKADLLASLETVFATPDTLPGFMGELCALAAGEQFYTTEMRLCTVQGGQIHVMLTMAFPEANSGDGTVLVSLMDLSERKAHEEEQRRLTAELARKNRELSQVVYVASHDLRSPLVNVQGFSRELKASLAELNEALEPVKLPPDAEKKVSYLLKDDITGSLDFILNSVSQMDRLLAGLLKISRLGRSTLSVAAIDTGKLVAGVVESLGFQLREMGAEVEVGALPPCRGDAGQIEQVFANLLGNAVKYAAPDRALRVRVTGETGDDATVYCVEDNGRGIAPEHQNKIFELFYRLAPGETDGEGLGLTTVRTVVDRHGGRVWVESELGRGSRFYFSVPDKAAIQ